MEPRLKSFYKSQILPELKNSLGVTNTMQVPKVLKIVINMGLGLDANDNKILKNIETDLGNITGQKPVITKSRKAISNFKTRANIPLGLKVTLRKNNMYYFLDRLINIALPRIKDFRGLNPKSFDENANYSFGIKEHVIFPEVNFDKVEKVRGMNITVVKFTDDKIKDKDLLEKFNFPFSKKGANLCRICLK